MKLLAKVAIFTLLGGVGATMYAAPNGGGNNDELLTRGVVIETRMKGDLSAIEKLHDRAKHDQDVIKLNCVNDKLVVAKPLMNISEHLVTELEGSRDHSNSETILGGLASNGSQMQELREGAGQCIDAKRLAHESSNSYNHPDVPGISGTFPGDENGGIEPPVYASPDR